MNFKSEVSIIIPVYNEKSSLELLIEKIQNVSHIFTYEIIIIDSGSFDGSSEIILKLVQKYKLKSIRLNKNKGKGFAVREGFKLAEGQIILIQDADLEYDPNDYNKLVSPILTNKTSFVLGSRHLQKNNWRIRKANKFNFSLEIINIGSQILTWIFCVLYQVQILDTHTMYKVFKKEIIQDLSFSCNRFDFDLELLGKLIKKGYQPIEVPVSYNSRTAAEGKKLHFLKDGLQALFIIFKVRFF